MPRLAGTLLVAAAALLPGRAEADCAAFIAEECKACDASSGKGTPMCEGADTACPTSVCDPVCSRLAWDVSFEVTCSGGAALLEEGAEPAGAGDFAAEVQAKAKSEADARCGLLAKQLGEERFRRGLAGQMIVHGCQREMKCCEPPVKLDMAALAEDKDYAGYFPVAATSIPACVHEANTPELAEAMCSMCKGAVKVTADVTASCGLFPKQKEPTSADAFVNSKVMMPQQIPSHRPFTERCSKWQTAVFPGAKAGLEAVFNERACECLGCCPSSPEGRCFYPQEM